MKNVIIYGGAFNPPTIGHEIVLHACVKEAKKINAQVWLMPSGSRPDKAIKMLPENRLQLLKAFTKEYDDLVTIELSEFYETDLVETYRTHDRLMNSYSDHRFYWVFGSDSVKTMREWGEGERLWKELDMIIIGRKGFELVSLPPKARYLELKTPAVSSTLVREKMRQGESIEDFVPRSVLEEITKSDIIYE